jgi:hypothetical protein
VRSDAAQPWHARYRSSNGRIRWTTENYTRRRAVVAAIEEFEGSPLYFSPFQAWPEIKHHTGMLIEVRDVDERTRP